MQTFNLGKLVGAGEKANQAWQEFLRVPSLSMGLYCLKAGQADPQQPHTEDEVYYVLKGLAWFRSGEEHQVVGPGTLIYVERTADHGFYDVAEDLTVLVFFAPAEGSQGEGKGGI